MPLVYNTSGYDSPEALALLDGVIDIYMPDMSYGDDKSAHRYSHVRDYVHFNQAAVREMHWQVGDLVINAEGLVERVLLVRHPVLPNDISGVEAVLRFLTEEDLDRHLLQSDGQYRPRDPPGLDRPITRAEFFQALALARRHGLRRLDPDSFRYEHP